MIDARIDRVRVLRLQGKGYVIVCYPKLGIGAG